MKALTNILTHLLMLLMLFIVACTEETAEVDNLSRGEQYVTVRMNIPGMTAATTRAADGAITSVTALSFNSSDQLLDVKTVNTINNVNANNGYNGNFNLTVPNGTQTIHFLANLPLNYSNEQTYVDFLKAKKGQSQVDVMTSLTTTDYNNLVYWGMTTYDGSNSTLSTTLYRNMAKISIKPSVEDVEFNQFTQEQLIIMGLDNPNTSGTLIPYNNGFHNTGVAPTYLTLPNGVTTLDKTPVGNEGAGYGYSLYVFEHANSNYMDKGLFVFCKIGDAYYSVALTRDGINPYEIKRNHEYIIYVSDVDDYQTNDYRAESYDALFDGEGKTVKKPINLEVKELESVTFGETPQSIDVDGNLTVTMTVPEDGTVTALTISAPGFTIKQGGSYTGSGLNIVGNSTVTYTFVPNTFGKGKEITFTASGTNLQETIKNIKVDVNAAISASPTVNNPTLYYDQDGQTVTVNVTMPKGLSAINIGGAENFTVSQDGNAVPIDNDVYTYTRNDATTTQTVRFVFTLDKSEYTSQQGNTSATFTFSDASTAVDKATSASPVYVSLKPTPEVTFLQSAETIYRDGEPLTVTMKVPEGSTLTNFAISAKGFTFDSPSGTYEGGTIITFTFTPNATGANQTITFTGTGTNLKDVNTTITVDVEDTKPAVTETKFWYEEGGKALSWSDNWIINGTIKLGDIVKIYVYCGNNPTFKIYGGGWGSIGDKIVWDQNTVTVNVPEGGGEAQVYIENNTEILSFEVTEELYNNSTISQGLILLGTDITVNRITLIQKL